MDSTTGTDERQEIGLLDTLDGEWLRLPLAAMYDVGPAAQTLAGLLKVTNKETFASVATIAGKARLPVKTVRKHLATLDEHGWLVNAGRQRTRGGRLRRTATIAITKQTRDMMEPYGILPWWACCGIRNLPRRSFPRQRLPWSARAVLAVWFSRLCGVVKALKENLHNENPDEDEMNILIADHSEDRFRFSLTQLVKQTGLSRESVVRGKLTLDQVGIVKRIEGECYGESDTLLPDWDFRVIETPAGGGKCFLDFDRGSESG